jgi:hypothetical protein
MDTSRAISIFDWYFDLFIKDIKLVRMTALSQLGKIQIQQGETVSDFLVIFRALVSLWECVNGAQLPENDKNLYLEQAFNKPHCFKQQEIIQTCAISKLSFDDTVQELLKRERRTGHFRDVDRWDKANDMATRTFRHPVKFRPSRRQSNPNRVQAPVNFVQSSVPFKKQQPKGRKPERHGSKTHHQSFSSHDKHPPGSYQGNITENFDGTKNETRFQGNCSKFGHKPPYVGTGIRQNFDRPRQHGNGHQPNGLDIHNSMMRQSNPHQSSQQNRPRQSTVSFVAENLNGYDSPPPSPSRVFAIHTVTSEDDDDKKKRIAREEQGLQDNRRLGQMIEQQFRDALESGNTAGIDMSGVFEETIDIANAFYDFPTMIVKLDRSYRDVVVSGRFDEEIAHVQRTIQGTRSFREMMFSEDITNQSILDQVQTILMARENIGEEPFSI